MTEKNNNDEILRVENLEKNEYLVSSSVIDVPEEKKESKVPKVGILRLIISAIAPPKNPDEQPAYYALRPVKTVKYALFALFFAVFIYVCGKIIDPKVYIPLFIFCASIVFPLLFITFHYVLNSRRNVTIFQLLFSFSFGILLYVVINGLSDSLLVRSIYKDTIDIFIVPFLWGIGEAFYLALISKVYGLTDASTLILLAVCVGMGYAFIHSLSSVFTSLFTSVEVVIPGHDNYVGQAIVDYSSLMSESLSNAADVLFWDCCCFPFLLCCWSVVMGTVASLTKFLGKRKSDSSFSVYLLLVLVIILYILTVFPTSIGYFELFLKIVCAVISFSVAVRLENNAIYDTINDLSSASE